MDYETVKQRAQTKVRQYLLDQKTAKQKYKRGDLTKEQWLTKHRERTLQINAIQSLFK